MSYPNQFKAVKDLSFKPRFLQNYGADEYYYKKSVEYITHYQDKLFFVDERLFKEAVEENVLETNPPFVLPDASVYPQTSIKPQDSFVIAQLDLENTKIVENAGVKESLDFGKSTKLLSPDRNALVVNTGGIITNISWSPTQTYLAILVINSEGGIQNAISSEELSLFANSTGTTIKSCIQIWRYDVSSGELELFRLLDTSKFGASSNLKWLPLSNDDIVGVLAGTFNDGGLHLFKIDTEASQYGEITSPSVSYYIRNHRYPKEKCALTCFDTLLHDRVLVGTSDGQLAEFPLPNYNQQSGDDDFDISTPSFCLNLADSPVSYISVSNPEKNKYAVHFNTTGITNMIFDYDNLRARRIDSFDSVIQPHYHHALKVYVCNETYDTVGYEFPRVPKEKPTLLIKTDGVISATAISKHLNHPLLLVSNSFGEIIVLNIARKILAQGKTTNKALVPLRLWKVEYVSSDEFVIDELVPVATELSTRFTASPPEINVSSVAWCENAEGGSSYAAGTHGGLLIIERLDPAYSGK